MTVTNARYRVVEVPTKRPDRQHFYVEENDGYMFGQVIESWFYHWRWGLYHDETVKGTAPTAQAALDALVAAYETGNGEAGE